MNYFLMNLLLKLNPGAWIRTYRTHPEIIYYVDSMLYQNPELTQAEINKALSAIGGMFANPLLDLMCGQGRHAIAMAQLGIKHIVALDYSQGFLKIARTNAAGAGVNVDFRQGDARCLPFPPGSFSTVTMLGNSFGYLSDEENERILGQIWKVLRQCGTLVFDISNKEYVVNGLKPQDTFWCETPWGKVKDERWRMWDPKKQRINCRKRHTLVTDRQGIQLSKPQLLLDTPYSIRLYSPKEIAYLLDYIGFDVHVLSSNLDADGVGSKPGLMSKLMTVKAVKL